MGGAAAFGTYGADEAYSEDEEGGAVVLAPGEELLVEDMQALRAASLAGLAMPSLAPSAQSSAAAAAAAAAALQLPANATVPLPSLGGGGGRGGAAASPHFGLPANATPSSLPSLGGLGAPFRGPVGAAAPSAPLPSSLLPLPSLGGSGAAAPPTAGARLGQGVSSLPSLTGTKPQAQARGGGGMFPSLDPTSRSQVDNVMDSFLSGGVPISGAPAQGATASAGKRGLGTGGLGAGGLPKL